MTNRTQTSFEKERNKATRIYRNIKNKNDASGPRVMDKVKRYTSSSLNYKANV